MIQNELVEGVKQTLCENDILLLMIITEKEAIIMICYVYTIDKYNSTNLFLPSKVYLYKVA